MKLRKTKAYADGYLWDWILAIGKGEISRKTSYNYVSFSVI